MQGGVRRNIEGRISSVLGTVSKLVKPNVGGIDAVNYDKGEEALEYKKLKPESTNPVIYQSQAEPSLEKRQS